MNNNEMQLNSVLILKNVQELVGEAMKKENLNLMIIGPTGVGKSTLINAIFGDKIAKTGAGKPITQQIESYKINEHFYIYDSKGIERKDYAKTIQDIKEKLQENNTKKQEEQIHIVWLCISEGNRRIEDAEVELLKLCREHNIPTIVVITKAMQDKDENGECFSHKVKEVLGVSDERVERVRALCVQYEDGYTQNTMGIENLIAKTYKLLPEAQKAAFIREQQYDKVCKKEEAQRKVNYYAGSSILAGAEPIPFADIAAVVAIQAAMLVHINKIYNIELSKDRVLEIVSLLGSIIGSSILVRLAGSALKFIPGLGSLAGGAISASVAATSTKILGNVYINYLDNNYENLSNAVSNMANNKAELEGLYKAVKSIGEK